MDFKRSSWKKIPIKAAGAGRAECLGSAVYIAIIGNMGSVKLQVAASLNANASPQAVFLAEVHTALTQLDEVVGQTVRLLISHVAWNAAATSDAFCELCRTRVL